MASVGLVGQVGLVGSGRSMFALTHLPTDLTYLSYLTLERRRLSQRPRRVDLRQVRTEVRGRVDVSEGVTPLGDIHASADFRAHLAQVNTARALRSRSP